MKEYNIEAYLEGSLTEVERIAFEKEMNDNPIFADEVENYKIIKEDLETIALRNEIKNALTKDSEASRSKYPVGKLLLFLFLSLLGVFVFLKWFKQSLNQQEEIPKQEQFEESPLNQENIEPKIEEKIPSQEKTEEDEKEPEHIHIAQDIKKEIPKQPYPKEELRGASASPDEWKLFLDSIWYSEYVNIETSHHSRLYKINVLLKEDNFSTAYARIQLLERRVSNNDTLSLMKGYCLLEMKRGAEALKSIEQIKEPAWSQHVQWYTLLGHLLTNDGKSTQKLLGEIAQDQSHHFHLQAIKKQEELRFIYNE